MEYLEYDAQVRLLDRLVKGATTGKYVWSGVSDNEYAFVLNAQPFGFSILSRDQDDYAPYQLQIFDLKREPARRFQTIETSSEAPRVADLLEELYSAVKRKVLHLDNMVEDLFDALDALEGPKSAEDSDEPPF
jgi:hypothetical protein